MPKTAESIIEQLGVESAPKISDTWTANALPEGLALGEPRPLFSTIPAAKLEEWREAYGGSAVREQKILDAEKATAKRAAKMEKKQRKKEASALKEGQ